MEIKKEVAESFAKKTQNRLRMIYGLILSQTAFTQYGTYMYYSWDIMEPITCMFGVIDLILGYSYWLWKNDELSLENYQKNYLEQKVSKRLKYVNKGQSFEEELEDLDQMIAHLELWKSLNGDSLPNILDALDNKYDQ